MTPITSAIPGFTENIRKYFDQVARERVHQGDVTREELDMFNEFIRVPAVLEPVSKLAVHMLKFY
jgi:hypothetical protein